MPCERTFVPIDPVGMDSGKGTWCLLSIVSCGANAEMSGSSSFKNNIHSVNQGSMIKRNDL